MKLNIENIIKYESYYFLRVLTFLQLYFARGPLIGPWVLLVWGRDCPPKCWLVAWIATQPIGRSGSRARHGGPFLFSHWLLSLPRQLAVAREFRPNGVPRLLLMTVPSESRLKVSAMCVGATKASYAGSFNVLYLSMWEWSGGVERIEQS